jgi:hypothetical protein
MKKSKKAKLVAGLISVPTILWLAYATFVSVLFGGNPFDNNPFDNSTFNRAHWIEDKTVSDGSNRRGHMAQDIVKQLKVGTKKEAILQMLGDAEETSLASASIEDCCPTAVYLSSGSPRNSIATKVLRYSLGEELAMAWGIDHAALFLYLDSQDRYVSYEIGWWK